MDDVNSAVTADQQPSSAENPKQQPVRVEPQPAPVQNQGLCPQSTFVGWHASTDCSEYFECDNGAMGVVHVCGESLKFDKVRNKCHPAEYVNSFCYGPPLGKDESPEQGGGVSGVSGGSGGGTTSAARGLCNEGFTGWGSRLGCKEYYWCNRGSADVIYDCGQDLLFDRTLELCNFAYLVHCESGKGGVPVPTPQPTPLPTPSPTPAPDPNPTFPPTVSEVPSIVGGGYGGNAGAGQEGTPSLSGMSGGVVGDYSWSKTATPTVPTNSSEIPPWLMNTVMTKNNGQNLSKSVKQLWMALGLISFKTFIIW